MLSHQQLRAGLADMRIAHHIRGRIRLKLETTAAPIALPDGRARRLNAILRSRRIAPAAPFPILLRALAGAGLPRKRPCSRRARQRSPQAQEALA